MVTIVSIVLNVIVLTLKKPQEFTQGDQGYNEFCKWVGLTSIQTPI